jgi:glycosyltransferase involved in cell wall biosynthesis
MLEKITPVLLTYNEQENIARTISGLRWAKDIVVVDSGSNDGTLKILKTFPSVRIFSREFDTHANQWRYATEHTNIGTDWLLRMDADYQLSDALTAELNQLVPGESIGAYRIAFDYAIFSKKLVASLYPPNTILLRRGYFSVVDRGHTEAWEVCGQIVTLRERVIHNDWKSTGRWLSGQTRYMQRELQWLHRSAGFKRRLRLLPPLMPLAVFLYCLFGKGLIFNGRAGMFYALQRLVAEAVLSLMVIEERLRIDTTSADKREQS